MIKRRVCIDVETTGLNPWKGDRVCGVAVADRGEAKYYPIRHTIGENLPVEEVMAMVQAYFDDEEVEVYGLNFKFDLRMLAADGVVPRGLIADMMSLARLVDNTHWNLNLKALAECYGVSPKIPEVIEPYLREKGSTYADVPIDKMTIYACGDVISTRDLYKALIKELPDYSLDLWENEKELTRLLFESEQRGVPVNRRLLMKDRLSALETLLRIRDDLCAHAGWEVDPNKISHKNELLIDQMGFVPTVFTKKTKRPKWSKDILEHLEIPDNPKAIEVGHLFRDWNALSSFESTYLDGWLLRMDELEVLHTDWKQAGTRTGRFAGSDPNLQNVPKSARRYIVAPDGRWIVGFDWSQIEYRVFAHYSKDPTILQAYADDPLADFHQATADMLAVPRSVGKMLNFAFLYGMGKKKLLLSLRQALTVLPNRDEILGRLQEIVGHELNTLKEAADAVYALYHKMFPTIHAMMKQVSTVAKTRGHIRGLFGRRWKFNRFAASWESTHKALNYLIQGSCGDLLRRKIVEVDQKLIPQFDAEFCITVHDSVYYYVAEQDVAPFYSELKAVLEDVPELRIPVIADGEIAFHSLDSYVEPGALVLPEHMEEARAMVEEYVHPGAIEKVGEYVASASGL